MNAPHQVFIERIVPDLLRIHKFVFLDAGIEVDIDLESRGDVSPVPVESSRGNLFPVVIQRILPETFIQLFQRHVPIIDESADDPKATFVFVHVSRFFFLSREVSESGGHIVSGTGFLCDQDKWRAAFGGQIAIKKREPGHEMADWRASFARN